jgi:hypothetical protein
MQGQRTGSNPVHYDTSDPVLLLRLKRLARELRLTDQILSFDLDSVQLVSGGPAPAWTSPDGSTITVDVSKMPGVHSRKDLAVWLGTNAHELFHNLFTPRTTSKLMQRITDAERTVYPGIHRSWNILEDQRIERLGLSRYEAWRGYLVAALSHHIPVVDMFGDTSPTAYLLVAGRTWLPVEVRTIARAAFVATNGGESVAVRAAKLIGDFQRLSDPGDLDSDEAWSIVEEFHDMFGRSIPAKGGCGSTPIRDGDPEAGEYQPVSYPAADEPEPEPDDDESDDDDGDASGDGSDDDDESDDDDGESGGESDDEGDDESDDGDDGDGGAGDDDESDDDDETDDGGESDGRSDDNDGDGDGDGVSGNEDDERTMREAMKDAVDEALSDEETADDLDRVFDQVRHGAPGGGDLPKSIGVYQELPDTARLLARDVSDVLSAIKDDNEAGWIRRTDSGRFSVDRWATDPDWDADNVFDRFQAGAMDASGLEVVLLCDVSGSMGRQVYPMSEAVWAIRTAVDRIDGSCTVLGFGDAGSVIAYPNERPDGRMFVPNLEGSTEPTEACREAHWIMAGSDKANKIVLCLTDGQWFDAAKALPALRACQDEGALLVIVGLGSNAGYVKDGFAGADMTALITRPEQLVPIFKDVAERSMLAAARR